jgi:RNA polymerase nonessential primary-like sigma factor
VPCGKDFDKPLVDTIGDESSLSATDILQNDSIKANLSGWLEQLSDKQREVICRRYGLCGYHNSTLEQVAQELGVTRERVRQIQMDALKRLKEILEGSGFSLENIL